MGVIIAFLDKGYYSLKAHNSQMGFSQDTAGDSAYPA
jgi:hypothetical protein